MSTKKFPIVPIMLGLALLGHLAVSWLDERRFSFRIVGPLSPFVGWWWILTLAVAVAAMIRVRALAVEPLIATMLAVCGSAAIWSYPGYEAY